MRLTRHEQARRSGLVLEEAAKWSTNDWPSLEGGWRCDHATVVLDHPDTNNDDDNNKGQPVVVLGGLQTFYLPSNSVLVLNLAESNKQWRRGPPMNMMSRDGHAAVVCNGGVYVMAGYSLGSTLNCIERIDAHELLEPASVSSYSSFSRRSQWTTLNCQLSTERRGCCAVAVHNRYIVVMGGQVRGTYVASVDILDTSNDTVLEGPSMKVPRSYCASAVMGHRIFVVGGCGERLVEYLEFASPAISDASTILSALSSSSGWTTRSDWMLFAPRFTCTMVAMGSCLVLAGSGSRTVDVLDTCRNRWWTLPPLGHCRNGWNHRNGCRMVAVANEKVAVIGGTGIHGDSWTLK